MGESPRGSWRPRRRLQTRKSNHDPRQSASAFHVVQHRKPRMGESFDRRSCSIWRREDRRLRWSLGSPRAGSESFPCDPTSPAIQRQVGLCGDCFRSSLSTGNLSPGRFPLASQVLCFSTTSVAPSLIKTPPLKTPNLAVTKSPECLAIRPSASVTLFISGKNRQKRKACWTFNHLM